MKNKFHPIYLAKLQRFAGEPYIKEFTQLNQAIQWVTTDGLRTVGGLAERAVIYSKGAVVWMQMMPMTPEREHAEREEAKRIHRTSSAHRNT